MGLFFCLLFSISIITQSGAHTNSNTVSTSQAHSKAKIIANKTHLVPGESISVGILIELSSNWHTYWKNPGDSASAPIFTTNLPDGYRQSPWKFPTPKRIPFAGLMSFGYSEKVLISTKISIPSSEKAYLGSQRKIIVNAEWVVCKEECIPAFFDFVLILPIDNISQLSLHGPDFAAIKFVDTVSTPLQDQGAMISIKLKTQDTWVPKDAFPYPKTSLLNRIPKIIQIDQNLYSLSFKKKHNSVISKPIQLLTLLENKSNGTQKAIQLVANKTAEDLFLMFSLAFLGGLILNFMPCTFPVLALKLFSLVKTKNSYQEKFGLHFSYQLGILVCFWLLAAMMIGLRKGGTELGWGFQMQSPWFIAAMILIFFTLGLNFLGVFELSTSLQGTGEKLTRKPGLTGSFFTGVLAVIVASPCTAPFMGVAMGYSLGQGPIAVFLIFSAIGFGLGFPYLFFLIFPQSINWLPKPGIWMVHFRELMAFLLWGTCIWLIYILGQLVGNLGVCKILISCLAISLLFWAYKNLKELCRAMCIAIAFLLFSNLFVLGIYSSHTAETQPKNRTLLWEPYQAELVEKYRKQNQLVFINFTADWCISCQVNEKTTFQDTRVINFILDKRIKLIKADWTQKNSDLLQVLKSYNRVGVPLYLFFPREKEAIILPELLTPNIFMEALRDI